MAEKIHFELVSPEKLVMSADVDMVVVPGNDGDFGVLSKHAPVVSTLRTGLLQVHQDGEVSDILLYGGFAEVNPKGLTVLAEEATPLKDVNRAALEADLKEVEADLEIAKTDEQKDKGEKAKGRLTEMLAVLDLHGA